MCVTTAPAMVGLKPPLVQGVLRRMAVFFSFLGKQSTSAFPNCGLFNQEGPSC